MSREGVHTKVSTYVGILALLVAYLVPAFQEDWWPFHKPDREVANSREQVVEPQGDDTTEPNVEESSALPPSPSQEVSEPERLTDFVVDYYSLMPDTTAGWKFIGPNLRLRGRDSYERFWSKFNSVEVQGSPTANGDFVTVRIVLYYESGEKAVEDHILGVVSCGDHLCIDSDRVV